MWAANYIKRIVPFFNVAFKFTRRCGAVARSLIIIAFKNNKLINELQRVWRDHNFLNTGRLVFVLLLENGSSSFNFTGGGHDRPGYRIRLQLNPLTEKPS